MSTEQKTAAPPPAAFLPTLAAAALLMTFLQFLTAWLENIYRMSLIKLEMGPEIAGLLIPLAVSLLVWLVGRAPGLLLRLAVLTYLALYALVWWPPTGPVATILYAGTGVALALTIAAHALNDQWAAQADGSRTFVLATLGLLFSRAAGNTLDLYASGSLWGLVPILTLLPLMELNGAAAPLVRNDARRRDALLATVESFGLLTFVYLMFSALGSLSSWESTSRYFHFLAVIAPVAALLPRNAYVRATSHLLLSALFFVSILRALWLARLPLPETPDLTHTVADYSAYQSHSLPLYIMLFVYALSWQFGASLKLLRGNAPVRVSGMLTAGLYFLVAITMLLIFTNVWGYVGPLSHALRNWYVLPFALAALAVTIPAWLLHRESVDSPAKNGALTALAFVLAIGTLGRIQDPLFISLPTGDTFTLLTYNIQQGSREDGDQAYPAQAEFIRKVNPDIVALQESDTARPSGGFVDTAAYFGRSLGYHTYYGPSTIAGTFGTAILSRYPIEDARTIYTYSDADEVGTAIIEITINGKPVRLYNNHPAGSDTVMNAHADMLVKEIAKGGPVIATGDFNSRPNEAPYKAIAAVLHDAWATLHPDAKGPGYSLETGQEEGEIDMTRRIDHIFFSDDFEVLEAHYVLPPESQTDHPAHWARLRIK